jgi:ribosome biogenesis GTPase A
MAKTNRELSESVKLVDLVIEVLDARIPFGSGNPDFAKTLAGRRRLVVLNKEDLADPRRSAAWKDFFVSEGAAAVFTNARDGEGLAAIRSLLREIGREKVRGQAARGVVKRSVRALVVGIPNSGKSSLINRLAGKAAAKTGDKPGVTRSRQWIRLEAGVELLDTPGLLWPKFENESVALHLAFTGAIKDEIMDTTEVAEKLLRALCADYPGLLARRYGIAELCGASGQMIECDGAGGGGMSDGADNEGSRYGDDHTEGGGVGMDLTLLEAVGKRRGFLVRGGGIDFARAAAVVLDEFRSAKIGRVTLERPPAPATEECKGGGSE